MTPFPGATRPGGKLAGPLRGSQAVGLRAVLPVSLLGFLAAIALLLPATSQAEIYWANGTNDGTTISRAANAGDALVPSFVTGYRNPSGVAVSQEGTHVYWSAGGGGTGDPAAIGRAGIDGGSVAQDWIENEDCAVPASQHLDRPFNLAIDSTHIYWIDWSSSRIGRATLDRTGPNGGVDCDWFDLSPYSPGYAAFFGVAVDDEYVYWTKAGFPGVPGADPPLPPTNGSIGRVAKDGTNPEPDFIGGGLNDPGGVRDVAVDEGGIFWIDSQGPDRIGRADLDGNNVNPAFVTSISGGDGIALDDQFIYWTYWSGPSTGSIGRVRLDGSAPEQNFIGSLNYPKGIYVTYASGSVTPANRDFGEAEAGGGTTGSLSLALEASAGNVPLTIDSGGITRTGTDPEDFQVTGGTCVAGTTALASGQSCTVQVAFAPSSVGAKSATLRIATNDGPFTSSLSGTGTEAPGPSPGPDPGPGPDPEPAFTQVRLSTKAKGVKVPRKGRKQVTVAARVTNSGDGAGSAAVSLRSSSKRVKVPRRLEVQVKAGASSSRAFKATVLPRAPRKVTLTAKLPDGKSARLVLKLRR